MLELSPTRLDQEKEPAIAHRRSRNHPRLRLRDRLYTRLRDHPLPHISQTEIDAHFGSMPDRYWERVTKSELMWGLESVHAFSGKAGFAGSPQQCVAADWRHYPERGFSKVMVCARDRPGLLAKIAGAFSALRVNILRAEVYTRKDNLALDFFEVADLDHSQVDAAARLQQLVFLLEGALSDPPRFASVWACLFHKMVGKSHSRKAHVEFDNATSPEHTLVRVEASDRLGLLHDLLQAFTDCEVNIAEAVVETADGTASDLFYVTDLENRKILNGAPLERIGKALHEAACW